MLIVLQFIHTKQCIGALEEMVAFREVTLRSIFPYKSQLNSVKQRR